ncbi:uncharacterized protein LOC134255642 [Saccostrea cucullata]|uniref:uncharacterized protein LOC134255642 n=1 Tax=Saccostrea cuccullata TaxID=36930 RepID=UPI002ED27039
MYLNLGKITFLLASVFCCKCATMWNSKTAGCYNKICNVTDIEDPDGKEQWYLFSTNLTKYDMNVLPAWCDCITGKGVNVAVVDEGVSNHTDLRLVSEIIYQHV